jgi:hypothetical protein
MRLRLGSVNLALLSIYFVPVWGRDAIRALISPYNGLDERVHATAAIYFRRLFDVSFNSLALSSHILAGLKLVIAAGFVAYAIEFARALATGRDVDRQTQEVVLIFGMVGIVIWALPAFALADVELMRLYATQMLLVTGAVIVITVDHHIENLPRRPRVSTVDLELPIGALAMGPPPPPTAEALARIPELRLRGD